MCFNPYPEPQLKGYVPSHNSRNTSNPTSEALPKALQIMPTKPKTQCCSSKIAQRVTCAARRCQLPNRLASVVYRQVPSASTKPHAVNTAWREDPRRQVPTQQYPLLVSDRLAETSCCQAPRVEISSCDTTIAWRHYGSRQAPHQYSRNTGSGLVSGTIFHPLTHIFDRQV